MNIALPSPRQCWIGLAGLLSGMATAALLLA